MTGDVGTASANHIRRRIGLARVVAVAVIASVGGHASGASFFHEVGVSVAMPTGVVVAVSYAPTFSVLDDRLRVGIGSRASAYFDDSTVDYPNGDPGLLAAGRA